MSETKRLGSNLRSINLPTILVVEEEQSNKKIIIDALSENGFSIITCNSEEEIYKAISKKDTLMKLVILGLILPDLNLELCKKLKQFNNSTPILIISSLTTEADIVLGLDSGADDYLTKPFGIKELVARCKALFRRRDFNVSNFSEKDFYDNEEEKLITYSNLSIYTKEYRATKDNIGLELSPKEYKLLKLFIKNPNRVWSREEILKKIWGHQFTGDTKTVDVHIRWLRKKIEDEPSTPKLILTVRGFGYRFC